MDRLSEEAKQNYENLYIREDGYVRFDSKDFSEEDYQILNEGFFKGGMKYIDTANKYYELKMELNK